MNNFKFEDSIGYVINRAALRLKLELQRAFKANGFDLSAEHWAVLNCLWENEGISQTEIATRIAKDKTNLTRILDVMEKNGLIRRDNHESDRRSYRIFITPKTLKMREKLTSIAVKVNENAKNGLSAADKREIIRIMNIISSNLEK